jgi:hypothetical protein
MHTWHSKLLLLLACVLSTLNTVTGQSIGYSGQFCAGSSIEFYTMGGFPCGEAMVNSSSSWFFSHPPASITFPNSFNYNRVRVTWNTPVSGMIIRASYTCSQSGGMGEASVSGISITSSLVPSVSLELSSTSVCQGMALQLQATQVNGGNNPVYYYYIDGSLVHSSAVSTYSLSTNSLSPGNHAAQVTLVSSAPCASPTNVASSSKPFSIGQKSSFSVSISGPSLVCAGTESVTFYAQVSGTTGNLSYEWIVNGSPSWGTSSIAVAANSGTTVNCRVYSDQSCVASPQVSSTATINVTSMTVPSASIQIPKLAWCPGETMTLTATSPQGGTGFKWFVNGNLFSTSNPASLSIAETPVTGKFYSGSVVSVHVTGLTGTCLSESFVDATTQGTPIVVNSTPVPQLNGLTVVCQNSEATYSTDPGMSNYRWVVIGGTVTAGGGALNNSISVRWSTPGTASLSVAYDDTNGCNALVPSFKAVTVLPPPTTANAGPDQVDGSTCGRESVILAGNTPTVGTGLWTIVSGVGGFISSPTTPGTQFTGIGGTTYVLRWTITNGPCFDSSDEVTIAFHKNPSQAFAGPDMTGVVTCGLSSIQLSANIPEYGNGSWTIISGIGGNISLFTNPQATFTGTPATSYTLRWTISSNQCGTSSDDVDVKFNTLPTPSNAGEDQIDALTCGVSSITLHGNVPIVGSGQWTIVSGIGGTISSPSSPSSSFAGAVGNAYVLKWTITREPCGSSADDVKILFNQAPSVANAGPDQQDAATCGQETISLQADSPTTGAGIWSIIDGIGGTFGNPFSATSSFTGLPGNRYNLRWTVNNHPCPSSFDEVIIKLNVPADPAQAGVDVGGVTTCGQTMVGLNANNPTNGVGTWTIIWGDGGFFADVGDPGSTFTGVPGTFYTLRWSIENSPCEITYDEVNVLFNRTPVSQPSIEGNVRFGEGSLDLIASGAGTGESYEWLDATGHVIASGSSYETPSITTSNSTTIFIRTVGANSCPGENAPVDITIHPVPTIQSDYELLIPGTTATLSVGAYDSYHWLSASGQTISTNQILRTRTSGEYRVVISLNGVSTTSTPFRLKGQFEDQITTATITYLPQVKGVIDRRQLEELTVDSVSQSIQYLDGLGRALQTVITRASPGQQDQVSLFTYDRLGREDKKHLPITTGHNGRYKPDLVDSVGNLKGDALGYYRNNTDDIADDIYPTAVAIFEPSPLNRILEQGSHGHAWQPGSGNTLRQTYRTNANDEVLLFGYDYSTGLLSLGSSVDSRHYQQDQLLVIQSLDEQGQETLTYRDKSGRLVCRKVKIRQDEYVCTYYVFDRLGNLVVVLPPEGVKEILNQD